MSDARRIIIVGFMGAGKTTVASALAARLNCAMIDLDELIHAREGRTPQAIIDEDGETRFRQIETRILLDALEKTDARIIALGGGAWTFEANRTLINAHGCLSVWLDAPFELCWQRIESGDEVRPFAREYDQARQLYRDRRALYELAALRVFIEEGESADKIAARIAEQIL